MDAALGRQTHPSQPSRTLFLGVAAAIGAAFLAGGGLVLVGRTPPPPPRPEACLIAAPSGLMPLDYVNSLETCGARLEAVYLEEHRPVAGAFGGVQVFADAQGIDAAALHGPRHSLISPLNRYRIDLVLVRKMRARGEGPVLRLDPAPDPR
jgi:hypothetical protein